MMKQEGVAEWGWWYMKKRGGGWTVYMEGWRLNVRDKKGEENKKRGRKEVSESSTRFLGMERRE
jgi:hypothetical protein